MRLAVLKERRASETRVAATPDTVKRLIGLGLAVTVEAGAGAQAAVPDSEYVAAGATIASDAVKLIRNQSEAAISLPGITNTSWSASRFQCASGSPGGHLISVQFLGRFRMRADGCPAVALRKASAGNPPR